MTPVNQGLFDDAVWRPALEKFGAVTHLTVLVYDRSQRLVVGPIHPSPLFTLFEKPGYQPELFVECARRCLLQHVERPAVTVAEPYRLAVVGTSMVLEGQVVGATVAGYVFVDFCERSAVERLAREAGIPFPALWEIARTGHPVPERRLILHGELLQVLGDAILRENYRARQFEEMAQELKAAAGTKDDFIAVLSHELRTPLTPILLWARMLKAGEAGVVQEAAEAIQRNAELQATLVDDLLELNRSARGKTVLDLRPWTLRHEIMAAVDAMMTAAKERAIELRIAEAPDELTVRADRDRLQQIFRNILSNAIKFTPAGGHIDVGMSREGGSGVVRIRDTGQGIAAEFLPHVFEMFRQQEEGIGRKHAGLGIGLALVKQLTELHGGDVTVSSKGVGAGTEVIIRLPLVPDPVNPPSPTSGPHRSELEGLQVLLVDDNADTREAIQLLLERRGARVTTATNGREGLEVVSAGKTEVILCDLAMPGMDGFEFINQLHTMPRQSGVPTIAMTGFSGGDNRRRIQEAGFHGHLVKPFGERALIDTIAQARSRR